MDLDPGQHRLLTVSRLLEQQLAHPWRLDDLARQGCYSRHHFERVFADLTGRTPIDYLRRRRLLRAALRVRHERTPLLQIAHEIGFASDSVFSRNFKQTFGFAPRCWRAGAWLDFHLDIQERWRRLHDSDPDDVSDESLMASLELNKPNVAVTAQVRYCAAQPVWLARSFGVWGTKAEAYWKMLAHTLPATEQAPLWCAITREDPGFVTGDECIYEWGVSAISQRPPGWLTDSLPSGYYLCLRYRGAGAPFRWLYSEWLERQQRWITDACRPHLNLFRDLGHALDGELRIPIRLR
ncbi:helix-turn-helix domain-containing protein [Chitiniphilus eburneus]|uniref:helix-turn-helix domain-containing protein n=1 Tax=Chitiniphilus eburneus TaxID=2571148 RepID=UPI00145D744B|nr:helix-turn-helix domain-containing protein [Chitiniphilus eburneus]